MCGIGSVSVAACDDGRWGYYGYGYGPNRPYICSQYSSCGSCTPTRGCGWCSFKGGGVCASDPDECGVNQFTWTWDPSGCGAVDGTSQDGGVSTDAGSALTDAATKHDARTPPAADAAPADARADR